MEAVLPAAAKRRQTQNMARIASELRVRKRYPAAFEKTGEAFSRALLFSP